MLKNNHQEIKTTISFVTTSKGRLHHIQETLPLLVAEEPDQIIVVDYDCPQGTGDWVERNFTNVRVVRVKGDPGFCLPLARNAGSQAVKTEWVFFIDGDIQVQPGFVAWLREHLKEGNFYRAARITGKRDLETYGSFACTYASFKDIGGYDEVFRGWGGEDEDIYSRLVSAGYLEEEYPHHYVEAIPHEDDERTAYHQVKKRELQADINRCYLTMKADLTKLNGKELSISFRQSLMKSIRNAFVKWVDEPDAYPKIFADFQSKRELVNFPGYSITSRLSLDVSRVDGLPLESQQSEGVCSTRVAIITICKGRLEHLKQTLPLMLAQSADEVVVVDYACPDGTADWVERNYPEVNVVRVNDDTGFNIARARNIGVANSTAEWLCLVDADIMIRAGWLNTLRTQFVENGKVYFRTGKVNGRYAVGTQGTNCVSRNAFEEIEGYDEAYCGWGGEDTDYYQRLESAGCREILFSTDFFTAIEHSDALRIKHYQIKDKEISRRAGICYLAIKQSLTALGGRALPLPVRMKLMSQAIAQSQMMADNSMFQPSINMSLDAENISQPFGAAGERFRIRQELVTTIERIHNERKPNVINQGGQLLQQTSKIQRVAMFHVGRSGSSVLANMLAQHSDVYWEAELYEKRMAACEKQVGPIVLGDSRCPILPLVELGECIKSHHNKLYGVEVKFFHLKHSDMELGTYIDGLKSLGFDRWILLRRQNLLRVVVSAVIGGKVGKFHAYTSKPDYPKMTIHLDPNNVINDRQSLSLLAFLDGYVEDFRKLEALLSDQDTLSLTYETDIEQNPYVAYEQVMDYLDVTDIGKPKINLRRTNPYPISQLISNIDEVRDYLRGTPYAWMAED